MRIKKGDTVKIIAGKDKGKTGKVLQAFPKISRVSIEGVNLLSKHARKHGNTAGQKIEFPSPIHISNVMLIDPRIGKPTKVSYKISADRKTKTRIATKSKEAIV